MPRAYEVLDAYLDNKTDRPWFGTSNNTRLVRRGEAIALRLHQTDIVLCDAQSRLVLNDGGWMTVTTKQRMNEFFDELGYPCSLYAEKGVWLVKSHTTQGRVVYDMHMKILPEHSGEAITDVGFAYHGGEYTKDKGKLAKDINNYAKKFIDALVAGKVPPPGPGDCFFCYTQVKEGVSLGDAVGHNGHLLSHIEENYFVPSLLWRACELGNKQKLRAYNGPLGEYAKSVPPILWSGDKERISHVPAAWLASGGRIHRQLTQALRKYLRARLELTR